MKKSDYRTSLKNFIVNSVKQKGEEAVGEDKEMHYLAIE